ncbi:uncharacterized protein B0I36DRAFT_360841 [Microdochium trichocladiopsis]|uniref:Tafazzin n=1 Tax=Microdochium trichocladiopsis TaxID=1682393 RepID=A0A9P8YCM1_9PEZI|nr:uncharacterized protein B0I36DRAFT_360841 [Microdochium trichocladiopsis]KAH7035485.1 hypothetical protein B0I36DRAFT_360841 [Microdochium trichocladiopsis]
MPKKRHPTQFTKPPTTAPASLSLSSSSSRNADHHERSVNELLANMRRSTLNSSPSPALQSQLHASPSVPPDLRSILQLPESPAPPPRRLQRRFINGRRGPPGPPPPRSWITFAESLHVASSPNYFGWKDGTTSTLRALPLPGAYYPKEQSLIAMVLRRMAVDWDQQQDWNRFYIYTLPSRLRTALIAYISELYHLGLNARDLRLILQGPPLDELEQYGVAPPDLASLNEDVRDLDLTGSIGRMLSVKEVGDLLFPAAKAPEQDATVLESWDAPAPTAAPLRLLPNLTRLSLAIDPTIAKPPSWKHLLAIASKLNTVTHLSLVGWPEPSLTPNAKHTKVISPTTGQSVQYSGTGTYSHTLDDDWTEATLILRRLSGRMYSLEYLDLCGCADWFPALKYVVRDDGNSSACVDWAGDWGKISTLRLTSGYALPEWQESSWAGQAAQRQGQGQEGARGGSRPTKAQIIKYDEWVRAASEVEKHIRVQRGGRGKWITVERDVLPEYAKKVLEWEAAQQAAR